MLLTIEQRQQINKALAYSEPEMTHRGDYSYAYELVHDALEMIASTLDPACTPDLASVVVQHTIDGRVIITHRTGKPVLLTYEQTEAFE